MSLQNRHCRLIALDISLDVNENPVLIEENIGGFSYWLLEMTGQDPFGCFTNEVVEYCLKKCLKNKESLWKDNQILNYFA